MININQVVKKIINDGLYLIKNNIESIICILLILIAILFYVWIHRLKDIEFNTPSSNLDYEAIHNLNERLQG